MSDSALFVSEVGQRNAHWCRSALGSSAAKKLGQLVLISEQQARRLLAGACPTSEQMGRLARHFGWRYVNFVFEGAVGTPAMLAEMRAFEERLSRLEAERQSEDAVWTVAPAGAGPAGGGTRAPVGGEDAAKAVLARTG